MRLVSKSERRIWLDAVYSALRGGAGSVGASEIADGVIKQYRSRIASPKQRSGYDPPPVPDGWKPSGPPPQRKNTPPPRVIPKSGTEKLFEQLTIEQRGRSDVEYFVDRLTANYEKIVDMVTQRVANIRSSGALREAVDALTLISRILGDTEASDRPDYATALRTAATIAQNFLSRQRRRDD